MEITLSFISLYSLKKTSQTPTLITPTESYSAYSTLEREDMINRLNKQYYMTDHQDIDNNDDNDDNDSSDSESTLYSHSNSHPYNNYKKKKGGFIPPQLNTHAPYITETENKPPPIVRTLRKKPESPKYRTEQLQRRHSKQRRSKPPKPNNKPPKPNNKPMIMMQKIIYIYG